MRARLSARLGAWTAMSDGELRDEALAAGAVELFKSQGHAQSLQGCVTFQCRAMSMRRATHTLFLRAM